MFHIRWQVSNRACSGMWLVYMSYFGCLYRVDLWVDDKTMTYCGISCSSDHFRVIGGEACGVWGQNLETLGSLEAWALEYAYNHLNPKRRSLPKM